MSKPKEFWIDHNFTIPTKGERFFYANEWRSPTRQEYHVRELNNQGIDEITVHKICKWLREWNGDIYPSHSRAEAIERKFLEWK